MDDERYQYLVCTEGDLTEEEWDNGWHYCPEWDFMLIGPRMVSEWDCCLCDVKKERGTTIFTPISKPETSR